MKKLMMAGGFLGFLIGLGCGTIQHRAWPTVLWRASVGAVCVGVLMRWWGRVLLGCVLKSQAANPAPESSSPAKPLPAAPKP